MIDSIRRVERPDAPWYNVKILRVYVAYLRERLHWTDEQVEELFRRCGSEISTLFYEDNWYGQDFADTFYATIVEMTGDRDIAYRVGRYVIHDSAKGIAGRVLAGFLSPAVAYKNIGRIAAQYSKGAQLIPIESSESHAVIRAVVEPGCHEKPYQCRNRLGMLEAVTTFFGVPTAAVEHPACVHRGDDYCEYHLTWVSPGQRHVGLFSALIFGIGATTAWLLTAEPLIALLFGGGAAGAGYSLLHYRADQNLRRALSEQVEALRISGQTIERRHQESLLVGDINSLVNTMMPIEKLCDVAARAIHEKMGYDRVTIFQVDQKEQKLITGSFAGFNLHDAQLLAQAEFNIDPDNTEGFLVSVVNTGEPIFVRDVDAGLGQLSDRSRQFVQRLGVKSFVAVPITFEKTVFGVIAADNVTPAKFLTSNDLQLLGSVANPIGVSFSNARAFEELQSINATLEEKVAERTVELVAARDQAIQANQAKSQFFATMSHELRTPLNAVIGYCEVLLEEAEEDGLEAFVGDLQKILSSAWHLLELIDGVLDVSKIEAGRMELYVESFDIHPLIENVESIAAPLARKNGNALEVSCEEGVGAMSADETKLRQVLLNLLGNACKFTQNGRVSLRCRADPDSRDQILFEVCDTGIGIPAEKIGDLFQEYSQLDGSTTKLYGGTGLGLVLSQRLCRMMGGDIAVTSVLGEGSCFTARLPRSVETPSLPAAQAGPG